MSRPPRFAADTEVSPEKSRAQIETLLRQHGATEYASGWNQGHDQIQFKVRHLTIRFVLPRPNRKDYITDGRGYARSTGGVDNAIAQAERQRWRALHLVIRAKLEAVEAGIATFEQEFLAFVVMANGATVGDVLIPRLVTGKPPLMLTEGNE